MIIQSLLLAILAGIGSVDEQLFGATMMGRPLVLGTLTGLILGDLQSGLIMGATLELMFMGSIMIGNAVPPEVCTSSVLGISIGILTNQGAAAAVALAVPISMLFQMWKNICFAFVGAYAGKKADECAERLDTRGISFYHLVLVAASIGIPAAIVIFSATYFGVEPLNNLVAMIPERVTNGFTVATGVLPAVGFGLLINLMINKKIAPYLFMGFVAAACLKMTVIQIAVVGLLVALLVVNGQKLNQHEVEEEL